MTNTGIPNHVWVNTEIISKFCMSEIQNKTIKQQIEQYKEHLASAISCKELWNIWVKLRRSVAWISLWTFNFAGNSNIFRPLEKRIELRLSLSSHFEYHNSNLSLTMFTPLSSFHKFYFIPVSDWQSFQRSALAISTAVWWNIFSL